MQEKIKSFSTLKNLLSTSIGTSVFILVLLLFSPAVSAEEWDVTPSIPYVGDNIVITGNAAPNQEIAAEISFENTLLASGGKYECSFSKVKIPNGKNNHFTARAENVKDLHIKVEKLPWITLSEDATGGIATISMSNVPPLTYEIKMYGDALEGESNVNLRITASQTITTDSEGNFKYEYDTDEMPPGNYKIKIGENSKTITLMKWHSSSGHSDDPRLVIVRPNERENDTEGNIYEEEFEDEFEEEPGEVPINKTNGTAQEMQSKTPAEERPALDGSFMVLGIIGSVLGIFYVKKLKK